MEDFLDYTDNNAVKIDEIKRQFQEKNEYVCILPYITRETEIFLSSVLKAVLEEIKQENLHSHLEYALNELSMNASKANSKRLYFNSKDLDINNPHNYEKGIINFKEDVFRDFKKYKQTHIDNDSFVKIRFAVDGKSLLIEIINNSPLLQEEKRRIAERLKIAHKFNNLTEVLAHDFDTTEGGGFGLIIVVLMLRKINLDEKVLLYKNEENSSISSIKIPLSLLSKDHGIIIAEEIANEITQMPQFPESIVILQRELSDPGCTFNSIADTINSDPSLAAEIIRIANSPVYMVHNKTNSIAAAVRLIGMLGVKSVLFNYGVNQIFNKKYNKEMIKEINDHSFYVAMIACFLARYKKLGRIAEDVYIAALLHDMGKIIINSLQKKLEIRLEELCREKHIPISILEDLTDGYNHALIGAEVAKKWNFPEKYINAIRFHHIPLEVDDEYKLLTYAIYLGNEIYYYNMGERDLNDINSLVLRFFGIEKKNDFRDFIESLTIEGLGA